MNFTAVPYARISAAPAATVDDSYLIMTTASAPCLSASSIILCVASSRALDVISTYAFSSPPAIDLMGLGLAPAAALDMGITNKSFDPYERQLVHDLIAARIPAKLRCDQVFDR